MSRSTEILAAPIWCPPLLLVLMCAASACTPFWCSPDEPYEPYPGPDVDVDSDSDSDTDSDTTEGLCQYECIPYSTCMESGGTWVDGDCFVGEICCDLPPDTDTGADTDTDTDTDPPEETAIHAEDACDPEAEYEYTLAVEDSNDLASPAVARYLLGQGLPVFSEIRRQAFLDYYTFDYAPPDPGHLAVAADLLILVDEDPVAVALQIGVRGEPLSNDDRRPLNIVLSMDTSGSMGGFPFQRLKAVCAAIAGNLKDGDIVSITNWSSSAADLLDSHPVVGPDDPTVLGVCEELEVGGSTDLWSGLANAYVLAMDNATTERANRVVLIGDGQSSASTVELDLIAEMAEDPEGEGIYLIGVGVGDGYDDTLLDDVTAAGKGAYMFVDTLDEAETLFGDPDRFVSLIEIAARDVTLDLTAPPGWYIAELHGPPDTPPPPEGAPQHLWANEEMVFDYLLSPCGPVDPAGAFTATVDYATGTGPYEPGFETIEFSFSDFPEEPSDQMIKGRAVLRYADTLEQVQQLMYDPDEYAAILEIINEARASIQEASAALGGDGELDEADSLLETYHALFE